MVDSIVSAIAYSRGLPPMRYFPKASRNGLHTVGAWRIIL